MTSSSSLLQVTGSGYNHKMPVLLAMLLDKISSFTVVPERFAVVREQLAKEYNNVKYQQPYQWAMYRMEVRCVLFVGTVS